MVLIIFHLLVFIFLYHVIIYSNRRVFIKNLQSEPTSTEDLPNIIDSQSWFYFFREYYYTVIHILLLVLDYLFTPFGFAIRKRRLRKDARGNYKPVILIHGYMMRGGALWPLKRFLRKHGFQEVILFTYEMPWKGIEYFAEQLKEEVDALTHGTETKVDLVAHSMGGLVARYYINFLGGDKTVETLITLGTPHQGTSLWAMSRFKCGAQMKPNSHFLHKLAEEDRRLENIRMVAISADFDALVIPFENSNLPYPKVINRKLSYLGHVGLVMNREAQELVVQFLKES